MMFKKQRQKLVEQVLEGIEKMERDKTLPHVNNWSWLRIAAIGERSRTGQVLQETYGSTRQFLNFNNLMFLPAQLDSLPLQESEPVDTSVILGPQAVKPMRIETPVMIAGMAYGVSIPLSLKRALAKGATAAGTATNSGEGGYVEDERQLAHTYIVQYNKAYFSNECIDLANTDMVEIRVGQGANPGSAFTIPPDEIGPELRPHLGLKEGEPAIIPARFPELKQPLDLKRLVAHLRLQCGNIPIAVKMAAGRLREDIVLAVKSGVDVIVIDGAEAGTGDNYEMTINNFGIPTIMAIPQAHRILRELHMRDRISLVAGGGLVDSGDFLKAIALGADAVYIGQSAIVATTYHQWAKMPPGTNPTEMFRYGGSQVEKFDEEQGTRDLTNFLRATTEEIRLALRAMGKHTLRDVSAEDLIALDEYTAKVTGVRLAY